MTIAGSNNYLLHHPKDVAGAKEIAATYCIDHMSECQHDAEMWDWTIEAEAQLPLLIFDVPELPEAGESKVSACTRNSFTADTKVLKADGAAVPIAAIKIGDEVLATDPVTGATRPETVTDVIVTTTDKDFTDLTVGTGDGSDTITSTQHHPYWDATDHQWKNAADLHPGDKLRQTNGTLLTVAAVRNYHHSETTYNLTVDKLHTYYVLAGAAPLLVHNSGGVCGVNNLRDGDEFYHTMSTDKGDVEMLAGVHIDGTKLHLSDVAVYGTGDMARGSLDSSAVLRELRQKIAPAAARQGFTEL